MRYTRFYDDANGETHFEDVEVAMTPGPVPPPAIGANVGERQAAEAIRFLEFPPGLSVDHPAPARQYFIVLSGEFRITVSDGETRSFGAGDVGLAEDTSGKGHVTVSDSGAYLAITELR
jgi:quercetin dioxygenase-like cupin family protein